MTTTKKKRFNFYLLVRRIHMYAGLIMIPYLLLFGISGLIFNHPTLLSNRTKTSFELSKANNFKQLFPTPELLARPLFDSLRAKGVLKKGNIYDIRYNRSLIARNTTKEADYRMEVNVVSSKARMLKLPDFVNNDLVVTGGSISLAKNDQNNRSATNIAEGIFTEQGLQLGGTRIQRLPRLEFDFKNKQQNLRILYNPSSGSYRVLDLDKRKFKISYLLTNLHEQHGYPVGRFTVKTIAVFLADCFAALLIIWGITGLVMWYKLKRYHTIGVVLISVAILGAFVLLLSQTELGY